MIKSMTGFGRAELSSEERKVSVEIKSVNHRYLELGIKLPKKLNFLENKIRNEVKKYVERGKVDLFIMKMMGRTMNVFDITAFWRGNITIHIKKSVRSWTLKMISKPVIL